MLLRGREAFVSSLLLFLPATIASDDEKKPEFVISTDVVIIGGGSAGTYAAISLLDKGIDFVVVEQQKDLGGHADTYTDPNTGQSVNAGVQIFHDNGMVRDYAARLGTPVSRADFSGGNTTTLSVDFTTGQMIPSPMIDPAVGPALKKYIELMNSTYSFLANGFFLPDPVPEDLLLPFGEFAKKNCIEAIVFPFQTETQGWDITKVPALYALMLVSQELAGDIPTADFLTLHDTNSLYRAAAAILGERVLFNSSITPVVRAPAGVTVNYRQGSGPQKTITAKRLLMTGIPVLGNLGGWDLSPVEKALFSKFRGFGYFAGAVSNPDFPADISFANVAASNLSFHVPPLPSIFALQNTPLPNKTRLVYYGTQTDINHDLAARMCLDDIDKLVSELGFGNSKTELLAWFPHGPFGLEVSTEDIRGGFYKELYGFQGHRSTWWTGSTFVAQDSAEIWMFTNKTVIGPLSAGL